MSLPDSIASPLTSRAGAASLKRRLPSATIVDEYRRQFGYDATRYFHGVPEVGMYECMDTGFRFYYPFTLVGDESLYRTLEQFPWNYKDDKWEHDAALAYLSAGQRVLDVG